MQDSGVKRCRSIALLREQKRGVIPSREDGEGSPASSVAGDSSPSSRLGMTHGFNIDAALRRRIDMRVMTRPRVLLGALLVPFLACATAPMPPPVHGPKLVP